MFPITDINYSILIIGSCILLRVYQLNIGITSVSNEDNFYKPSIIIISFYIFYTTFYILYILKFAVLMLFLYIT
jgi:hypothetical protein